MAVAARQLLRRHPATPTLIIPFRSIGEPRDCSRRRFSEAGEDSELRKGTKLPRDDREFHRFEHQWRKP
jgi:hypothetical protein